MPAQAFEDRDFQGLNHNIPLPEPSTFENPMSPISPHVKFTAAISQPDRAYRTHLPTSDPFSSRTMDEEADMGLHLPKTRCNTHGQAPFTNFSRPRLYSQDSPVRPVNPFATPFDDPEEVLLQNLNNEGTRVQQEYVQIDQEGRGAQDGQGVEVQGHRKGVGRVILGGMVWPFRQGVEVWKRRGDNFWWNSRWYLFFTVMIVGIVIWIIFYGITHPGLD